MKILRQQRTSGAALIIVLAFVVLLAVLALAYFSRTVTDRQVAQSSFRQTNADQLALSATDVIVADLKQEIVNGSATPSTDSNGNNPIYTPTSNANMLPMRSGNPSGVPDPIPNLVRRSWANDSNLSVRSRASAVNSTNNVSANGRYVTSTRWNSHHLVPKKDTTTTDSLPIDAFTSATPDWVFVTNQGPGVITSPSTSAIGRYAYVIYDEGGLLDLNEAGYPADTTPGGPNGLSPTQIGPKGALALADLTQLPTAGFGTLNQGQVNNLVGWRNSATAQLSGSNGSYGNYTFDATTATNWLTNFVNNNSTGFLKVSTMTVGTPARTDQALLSRQQLLALTLSGSSGSLGFSQNVLRYLGTFSRELNAPSWGPTQNAVDLGGSSSFPYKDNRDSSSAANRFFPNVRVSASSDKTITSYKSDGSSYTYTIPAGQPLVQRRFPLDRINWLGRNGPQNGGTNANIKACFGLLWDASTFSWKYVGPSGSTTLSSIATLNTVAGASREPNFFELLKAGILSGSLGLQPGAAADLYTVDNTYADVDGQVIQIGANIIDQFDADSFPTRIQFGTRKSGATVNPPTSIGAQAYYGSENVPAPYRLVFSPYRPKSTTLGGITADPTNQNNFDAWLEPVLWTPARGPVTDEPLAVRLHYLNGTGIFAKVLDSSGNAKQVSPGLIAAKARSLTFSRGTQASLSSGTQDPRLLRDLTASGMSVQTDTGYPEDIYTDGGVTYVGFWIGQVLNATKTVYNANVNLTWNFGATPHILVMEANYATTSQPSWQEIQRIAVGKVSTNVSYSVPDGSPWATADVRAFCYTCADPRTGRFGLTLQEPPKPYTVLNNTTATPPHPFYSTTSFYSYSASEQFQDKFLPTGTRFNPPGTTGFQSGYRFYDNTSTTAGNTSPFYTDPDGVQRAADGRWTSATNNTDSTLYDVAQKYRPIQLNRPFRSVGELSYALRDLPWKSLDFSTSKSADAGLLDLFSVTEQDPTSTMVAGKCSLNTRNSAVLQAILAGAFRTENSATDKLSSTDATNVANALVTFTSGTTSPRGPLVNKSELVTRFAQSADLAGALTGSDDVIKSKKELVIRALSEAGQTRSWNLLIDVIAQSGHYKPNPTSLQNDFIVEGEQRYWVHVAIDRFTGQVVDRQYELVKQ